MSDQDEQGSSNIVVFSDNYTCGNNVTWEIVVNDLNVLQHETFEMPYETFCETSHSEWKFRMSLPEVREDGTCSLYVGLVRTDDLRIELDALICISFYDVYGNLIFDEEWFTETDMVPGDLIEETVEMTPLPGMRDAVRQTAKVKVLISINYIHPEMELDRFE